MCKDFMGRSIPSTMSKYKTEAFLLYFIFFGIHLQMESSLNSIAFFQSRRSGQMFTQIFSSRKDFTHEL